MYKAGNGAQTSNNNAETASNPQDEVTDVDFEEVIEDKK